MNTENIRKEIESKFKECGEAGANFSKLLHDLRTIKVDFNVEDPDETKQAIELGREIDMRTAHLLRLLLVQHGNVLFL